MISSEVQRTLVKSPPELWTELSDPASLARHLGELGDVRILRTDPESTVEWAAENFTGTVSIKPSGWGTKVTLSVTRAPSAPAPAVEEPVAEPETDDGAEAVAEPEVVSEPGAADEASPEPNAAVQPEPVATPEPRRGFFARLFGRRSRREEPTVPAEVPVEPAVALADQPTLLNAPERTDAHDAFAAVKRVLAPETFATEHPFAAAAAVKPAPAPDADIGPEHAHSISAELMAAEEAGAEEVTAVLTEVLDRLGAAHHRPFSRA
jgi:hypothetical protein